MKKTKKLSPLRIDRETLAVLSDKRLEEVIGASQSVVGHPCSHSAMAACVP